MREGSTIERSKVLTGICWPHSRVYRTGLIKSAYEELQLKRILQAPTDNNDKLLVNRDRGICMAVAQKEYT